MEIPEIEVAELVAQINDGATVLDVRNQDEFAQARISGVVHIPLDELEARYATELDKEVDYFIVCAKGGRSKQAAEFLFGQGYKVTNVMGGTDGWIELGNSYESG